MIKEVMHSK